MSGRHDEHGDAGAFLEEAHFLPEPVFAGVVAVIAGEDDDGIVGEAETVEGVYDASDLCIHEADAGVVGLETFATEVVRKFVLLFFVTSEGGLGQIGLVFSNPLDDAHFAFVVFFEIGFRRNVGRVRAEEPDGEEEGPRAVFCATFEDPFGITGIFAVRVFGIGFGGRVPTECAAELPGSKGEDFGFLLGSIDAGGVHFDLPRCGIVMTVGADGFWDVVVEEFSDANGEISVLSKHLWERGLIGDGLAEDEGVCKDAGAVGVESGQEGVSAGAAEGEGAIGAIKSDATLCEFVDVGGLCLRIAVAAEEVVEVVGYDEEDVLFPRLCGRAFGGKRKDK